MLPTLRSVRSVRSVRTGVVVACLLIGGFGGCALDENGIVAGGNGDGAPVFDASGDTMQVTDAPAALDVAADTPSPIEAGVCDTDANDCQPPQVPTGWTPVAYVENPQSGCPADWNTPDDYVTSWTNGSAACGCSCSKTSNPGCTTGTIQTYLSGAPGCGTTGLALAFTNGGCVAINGNLNAYYASTAIAPTGGQCAIQATSSGTLQSVPARLCAPSAECTSVACGGYAPGGWAACIVADGDQACPSASMFSVKHSVAKTATPSCAPTCGTGCTFQGTCDTPQVHVFTDNQCNTALVTLASDGTCVPTNQSGVTAHGITYAATPNFTGCTATGSTSLQIALATPKTVCCKP